MPEPTKRKLTIAVNGVSYRVEIGDLSRSPVEVNVDGEAYLVEIGQVELSRPMVVGRTQGQPGLGQPVSPKPPSVPSTSAADLGNAIRSPMPGDIVDIQVQPGDQVEIGQQICHLEAMKMKSAIRAGRAGVIASVEVSEGQPVAHGDVLVTFK